MKIGMSLSPQLLEAFNPESQGQTYGAYTAVRSWFDIFGASREIDEVVLFGLNEEIENFDDIISIMRSKVNLRLAQYREIPGLSREDFVFHHPGNLGETLPWRARAKFAERLFPIMTSHTSLSYPDVKIGLILLSGMPWHQCDRILAISESSLVALRQLSNLIEPFYPNTSFNFEVCRYGIAKRYSYQYTKSQAKNLLNIPGDSILIVSLGRLSPLDKMDLTVTLQVIYQVCSEIADKSVHCVIAGSDHYGFAEVLRQFVESLGIGSNVSILPNISEDEKSRLLIAADIFISLSDNIQESFGISLVEAISYELPIICSNWNGYRDIVIDGYNGFLIKTNMISSDNVIDEAYFDESWMDIHFVYSQLTVIDHDMAVNRILELSRSQRMREQMGLNGLRLYRERYTPAVAANNFVEIAKEAIEIAKSDHLFKNSGTIFDANTAQIFGHYPGKSRNVPIGLRRSLKTYPIDFNFYELPKIIKLDLLLEMSRLTMTYDLLFGSDLALKLTSDSEILIIHAYWLVKHDFAQFIWEVRDA
ncbi:glycosyltransferase family 4 protein [Deinococcus xianganensis]|uniref:Glycosyltransferase n=1 Tax=Deinococcus xianganensis TaxID=1507289 RepID=A0A6I4YXB0_9DEIO|nr:glycosyltransferase family 4 protein [Deinococcus xianganensis]MXV21743.1 glycosyltransferase [Deinococcus xianganensis]